MPKPCEPKSVTTKFNFFIDPHWWDIHDGWTEIAPNIFVEDKALPGYQEQVHQIINGINCGKNKIECACLKNKISMNIFMISISALEGICEGTFACTKNNRVNIILENVFAPSDNPVDLCELTYHELMHTIDACEACYDDELSAEIDRITNDFYVKFKNQIPAIEKEIIDTFFKNEEIQKWFNRLFNGTGFETTYDIQTMATYIRTHILGLSSRFFDNAREFRAYSNQFCVKGIRGIISEFLYLEFTNEMPELEDFERSVNTIVVNIITDIYQKYFQENLIKYCESINQLRTGGCNTSGLDMEFVLQLKATDKATIIGDSMVQTEYNVNLIVKAEKNSCCRKTQGLKGLKNFATVNLCPQCPKKCIFYYNSPIDEDVDAETRLKNVICVFEMLFMGCDKCTSGGSSTQGKGLLSIYKVKESIIKDFDDAIFNSVAEILPGLVRGRKGCPC
jgi:hypothetical protein